MNKKSWLQAVALLIMGGVLPLSPSVIAAPPTSPEAAQINTLIRTAKTKADHEKIAQMLDEEAGGEEVKARALPDQAEAYKEHKHSQYGKNIADLEEHTEALARHYQDAARRHKALADIHRRLASEAKP